MNVVAKAGMGEVARPGSPMKGRGQLPVIQEDALDGDDEERKGGDQAVEIDEQDYDLEKPTYFDEFDEAWIDSEDEMVAGENNYIEIQCLPLDGEPIQ